MTDEARYGREPIQLVGLKQPRCSRRFGVAPCTASLSDGARCYQTWTTCLDRPNILYDASIEWIFAKPEVLAERIAELSITIPLETEDGQPLETEAGDQLEGGWPSVSAPLLTFVGGQHMRTNPIPSLVGASASASRLNIGAAKDAESPFGVRSSVTVMFKDIPWDDHVGDFSLADRAGTRGYFWQKWVARNEFYSNMYLTVYEGYRGQPLEDMQQRLYVVEKVDGPNADGSVSLTGIDPLRLADSKRAKFPRETPLKLVSAISNVQTTGIVIQGALADLTDQFGNGGARGIRIGSEILTYTGQTETGPGTGQFTLSGVVRANLGTTAAAQSADAAAQRVGRFVLRNAWDVAYTLLTQYTDLPAQFIDKAQWDEEAALYLTGFDVTATIPGPVAVETLLGELMQQCSFYIWWDERRQTIPLKAVRPEPSSYIFTDEENILANGSELTRDANAWFTQLIVYYLQRDPTKGFDPTNFERSRARIDGEVELEAAADTVRQKVIYSRWLRSEAQATELTVRLLGRYRRVPRFLSVKVDAKDRSVVIGDIVTVRTWAVADSEGNVKGERWQVIRADEVEPGHAVLYDLQEFQFLSDRYARFMDVGAVDFAAATDLQKETGGWYAQTDGEMPDGTAGFAYQ